MHSYLDTEEEQAGPSPVLSACRQRSPPAERADGRRWSAHALQTFCGNIWPSFWPCLLYGSCSCALHITNKLLLSALRFHYVFLFTALQACIISALVPLAAWCGLVRMPRYMTLEVLRKVGPLAVLNILNTVIGLKGLQHMKLPQYLLLRRLLAPTVVIIDWLVAAKSEPLPHVAALCTMTAGALMAALADPSFSLRGVGYTLLANLFTSAYTMWMNRVCKERKDTGEIAARDFHAVELIFFNSLLSLPLLVACSKFHILE